MGISLPKSWELVKLVDQLKFLPTGVNEFIGTKEYYSTGSIQENEFTPEGEFTYTNRPSRANRIGEIGDVLQARMKATNKGILVDERLNGQLFSTGFLQVRPYGDTYNNRLLYYLIKSEFFLNQKNELATGSTQEALTDNGASEIEIPLPPLAEQYRLVAKLDKLLAKFETANFRLEKIPLILKRFRQSVLATFFDLGDETHKVSEVCEKIQIGPFGTQLHRSDYVNSGIPVINPTHIVNNSIKPDFNFSISKEKYNTLPNYHLKIGDVIMGRRGEMARCALVDKVSNGWFCGTGSLYFRPVKSKVFDKYLFYALSNQKIKSYLENESRGTTMDNLNLRIVNGIPINIPSIENQKKIVNSIEQLLKVADKLEERYKKAKTYTDKLQQSILAKAFRGELVPQDINDEPASILLEKIKREKEKLKGKKTSNIYELPIQQEAEDNYYYKRIVLAAYIVNQSLKDSKFGDTKFEKLFHLSEYCAVRRNFGQTYYRKTAGPYDNVFTKGFLAYIKKSRWFIHYKQNGKFAFKPDVNHELSKKHVGYFSKEQLGSVNKLIGYFKKTNYEQPEIVSTLYAVWNNRIILQQEISDELLIQDFYQWSESKSKYEQERLQKALEWMREKNLVPDGWGKVIGKSK